MKRAYDLYDPLGKGHGTKSFYTTTKLRWMGLTAPKITSLAMETATC
jgi:hypothetical protein